MVEEEKSNYDKICNYFQSSTGYSREEIINGLIGLRIAPKGKGLLSKLFQEISFRVSYGKQVDGKVMVARFMRFSKHSQLYNLKAWCNEF